MGLGEDVLKSIDERRQALGNPRMTWAEISKHRSDGNCYIVISNMVFDVSDYMKRHPGGPTAILRHAGKDATSFFERVGAHTSMARNSLPRLFVADVGSSMPSFGGQGAGKSRTGQGNSSCNCTIS